MIGMAGGVPADHATVTPIHKVAVVSGTDMASLQALSLPVRPLDAKVFTDNHAAYRGMRFDDETVNHGVGEYVREQAHTNGIESF